VAINTSSESITAKAIHEVGPAEASGYFQTIQCFCFTEQTLEPGEQREMQLLFRIDFTLPPGIELFRNRYTFYALEDFPADG
jgi:cytochrome c oxidase assembly protein subunit 11